jgi:oligosaccharide repeat unit polymerase
MIELLLLFIYKVALDAAFFGFILPISEGEPYLNYGDLNVERLLLGYVLLPLLWQLIKPVMNPDFHPVSRLILMVQFSIIVLPMFSLFAQVERPTTDLVLILSGFFTVVFLVRWLPGVIVTLPSRNSSYCVIAAGAILMLYVYGGLIATGGLSRLNFSFYDVYAFREQFHDSKLPLFGYAIPWVAYIINMAILIYAAENKKFLIIAIVFVLQIMLFGMTNYKAFLFIPFVVITFTLMMRHIEFSKMVFFGGAAAIVLLVIIGVAGEAMGFAIARRVFIVPSALHCLYFEYFSNNPVALLSGTHWAGFFGTAPYTETTLQIIAEEYWKKEAGPNVGWMGDAYANFGIKGLFIYAILLSIFLKMADSIAVWIHTPGIVEALFIGPALALCSSAFNSVLLTHGGLVVLPVLWVLARQLSLSESESGFYPNSHSSVEVVNA